MTTEAEQLLKQTTWFCSASPSLLEALADKMTLVQADRGHVFVEEGEEMKDIIILESGSLVRSKRAKDARTIKAGLRSMNQDSRLEYLSQESIIVDRISGRGQVTGLMHGMHTEAESRIAFATVTADDQGGPTKAWTLPNKDLRAIISQDPAFALDMLQAMSIELRAGSKSLRSLVQAARSSGRGDGDRDTEKGSNTIRVLCYDTTNWVRDGFTPAIEQFNRNELDAATEAKSDVPPIQIEMDFTTERLSPQSSTYAAGYDAVCLFVNDNASADVLQTLSLVGVKCVAMRCAGFDRVDTRAARTYGMTVVRVPAYSPYAVAEHAIALLMAVNRKIAKASNRVKMANFTLDAGLMGIDIHGKTVGVMGTGKIGQCLCDIILGFGANLICFDVFESDEVKAKGGKYVTKDELYAQSDVIFLMMPLLKPTYHTINDDVLPKLKKGVLLINTSRGGLVDTNSLLKGLQSGIIGGVGMDVYENEGDYFFQDWSAMHLQDPVLMSLLGDSNVVLTAHQAFFTKEAVDKIIATTVDNLRTFHTGETGFAHPNNCIPPPTPMPAPKKKVSSPKSVASDKLKSITVPLFRSNGEEEKN